MRAAAYALAAAGCASPATTQAVPPVMAIPSAPLASPVTSAAAPASLPTPSPPAADKPPWIERTERSERTHGLARCQITPFSWSSVMVVENRPLSGSLVGVRIVQDDETVQDVPAPRSLLGKGYRLAMTDGSVQVTDLSGGAVPPDEAQRVGMLGAAHLGWPGAEVAAHPPAPGSEVTVLESSVLAVAAVPLHGSMTQQESRATVQFTGTRKGDEGDELVFDVHVSASRSEAGMCHRWQNVADLKGELWMRARGGAVLGLHLQGETHDTEGLCQDPSGRPGPPPPPHLCNRGDVVIEVRQPHPPE